MYKLCRISKISDMSRTMTVARQHDRNLVLHTILQNLPVICPGIAPVSIRSKRSLVNFKNHPKFLRRNCKRFIVNRKLRIITMSKNLDTGMLHCIQICTCVFFHRSALIILCMHTCNRIVQLFEKFIIQIHMSVHIKNIQFNPKQQLNPKTLFGRIRKTPEIRSSSGSKSGRSVICDAK